MTIVAPETRDLNDLNNTLVSWLQARLGSKTVSVSNLRYPIGAGMSHETILFDAHWEGAGGLQSQGMVVRIKPTRQQIFVDDLFEEQFRLMRALHEHGAVRVAKLLWLETDASLLGAPFFVMERLDGRVAVSYPPYSREGWLFDAAPADRRRMWRDAVTQLALIQRTPVNAASFLRPEGMPKDGCAHEFERWGRYLAWVSKQLDLSFLHRAFERLKATQPVSEDIGIIWGDARLGNLMIDKNFQVAAIMDWEQPALGSPLHDLGWWLRNDYTQTTLQGIKPLEGLGNQDETIALWSEVTGKSAADIEWYITFAIFKMMCLAARMSTMWKNSPSANFQLGYKMLADRLGIAAP